MDYLQNITKNGKAIYLAYDHGLEHGPVDFLEKSQKIADPNQKVTESPRFSRAVDPEYILEIAQRGEYTGVILQKGVAEKYYYKSDFAKKIPLILKLNGKTNIWRGGEPYSPQVCSVEYAKKMGAAAVGYTIYLGSAKEEKMFKEFGRIVEEAHKEGLAAIAWVYPRGEFVKDEMAPGVTIYAARTGLELGADMVKIKYCGSKECFEKVVKAAGRTKVVLSGGPKLEEEEWLGVLKNVMAAGAIGVAVGRNVWQHPEPLKMTEKIKQFVFDRPT